MFARDAPAFGQLTALQEGIATFVEWQISAEFATVDMSAHSRALTAKQKLLRFGNQRPPSVMHIASQAEDACALRVALTLQSLADAFDADTTRRFVAELVARKRWSSCATNAEVAQALVDTTLTDISRKSSERRCEEVARKMWR